MTPEARALVAVLADEYSGIIEGWQIRWPDREPWRAVAMHFAEHERLRQRVRRSAGLPAGNLVTGAFRRPVRGNKRRPPIVKNRIHGYEAGWLTFLISQGIASEEAAREAMNRTAQAALDELARRRELKKKGRRRRRDE